MKALAIVLAIAFLACAALSFVHPLPPDSITRALGFSNDKVHEKHPVLYIALAVLSLIWLRFQTSAPAR